MMFLMLLLRGDSKGDWVGHGPHRFLVGPQFFS